MSEAAREEDVERWRLPLSSGAAGRKASATNGRKGFWRRAAPDARPLESEAPAAPRRKFNRSYAGGSEKPKRLPASRRSLWQSPLTRRILALNIMALLVPVLGLLYLPTYRDSLLQSELELLKTEGKLFSGALAASGVVTGPLGDERLLPETSRQTIRRLVDVSKTRARLFTPDGTLIADSFMLSGPGGIVTITPLPPLDPDRSLVWSWISGAYDWVFDRLPSSRVLEPYQESAVQNALDYNEVVKSLGGEAATYVRDAGKGKMILSAAVPVQRYRQVLGGLLLTKSGDEIEATLRDTRLTILGVSGVALGITILISLYLASTIALPIHRLADAADRVRRAKGRQQHIPDLSNRSDEIGDLSGALRDMTEAVWRRMDAIEGFAADVAHEIKNPLTSLRSAVETVARVEDPQQQKKLMGIILDDVQRLDRLISDISDASRVDAEISRAEAGPVRMRDLTMALVDIHATTGNGGEEDLRPRLVAKLPEGDPLVVLGTEGRLGQVLRNLVANAISFSPAKGVITLAGRRKGDRIFITVEDDGPGIPTDKLTAIFERFYSERPKGEKFGTHSGLGLSISKQIVEAYGGKLSAENRIDASGRIMGARFVLDLIKA
jgi:two-component system sensor histidine kinase ChvG